MMHTRVKHCTTLLHCKHCTFYHISTLQTLWNQCESQVGSGVAHKSETLYHIITLQTLWSQCERQEGSGDAQKRRTSGSYLMLMHPRPVAYRNLHNAQTMHNAQCALHTNNAQSVMNNVQCKMHTDAHMSVCFSSALATVACLCTLHTQCLFSNCNHHTNAQILYQVVHPRYLSNISHWQFTSCMTPPISHSPYNRAYPTTSQIHCVHQIDSKS